MLNWDLVKRIAKEKIRVKIATHPKEILHRIPHFPPPLPTPILTH